jgi:hypothetical protein
MTNLFKIEFKILKCDICKERPVKDTIKVKGEWLGLCLECMPKKEVKNET